MKVYQQLASGISIRQDFRDCVRFVMYETGYEKWMYATHGGTAFVVNFRGIPYGITCRHILGDFGWKQLVITDTKYGTNMAGIRAIRYPSEPLKHAQESDILDVAVIQFSDDIDLSFFGDSAYRIDTGTIGTSSTGDSVLVYGALKEKSAIVDEEIRPIFAYLEFSDAGSSSNDVALRKAQSQFQDLEFESLTGLSGSPVFNSTSEKLCGMIVRGGMIDGSAIIRFVDFYDILQILTAISDRCPSTRYTKTIKRPNSTS